MQKNYTTKKNLVALLAASDRIHKIEMVALASEVTRIKQAFIKSHGRLPPIRHARKSLL
jgi:hypothetical protein